MAAERLSYCATEVRRYDPDRFLTALFAPAERREGLFALYAFNLELAKTREVVSEPLLGSIRLQWWRETIAGIYAGTLRQHETVLPLAALVAEAQLSRRHFDRLIEGRERDLEEAAPPTVEALIDYAEATSSSLVALALETLGVRGEAAEAAARETGVAWALTGLLRAVPFHARQRRRYLPDDLMAKAGANASELFERGRTPGLATVVAQVAALAERNLAAARRHRRSLPRAAHPALLTATLADLYLAEIRRARYDPFSIDQTRKRPLRPLRLMLAATLGRY